MDIHAPERGAGNIRLPGHRAGNGKPRRRHSEQFAYRYLIVVPNGEEPDRVMLHRELLRWIDGAVK